MIFRVFIYLIGFGLAVSGGVTIIAYLNILATGQSFIDYLLLISKKFECYLFIIGVLLITFSIYFPSEKK